MKGIENKKKIHGLRKVRYLKIVMIALNLVKQA